MGRNVWRALFRPQRIARTAGRSRRGEHGQGIVEFALVAPVLLLLAFGVFDFGRGMSANVTVTNASREGARYLAVNAVTKGSGSSWGTSCYGAGTDPTAPAADSAEGKAWRQLQTASLTLNQVTISVRFYKAGNDPANNGTPDISVTCSGGSPVISNPSGYTLASGDWVQCEVKYQFAPSTPLINNLVSQLAMDRVTTMVLE